MVQALLPLFPQYLGKATNLVVHALSHCDGCELAEDTAVLAQSLHAPGV